MPQRPTVAIACQGGGSHAAFSAGVLAALLSPAHRERFDLLALSGTSGGAVCATLAWSGLLAAGPDEAIRRLDGFWRDLAISDPLEAWFNAWTQILLALPISVQASPYAYSPAAEPRLRALLERWVPPEALPGPGAPRTRPWLRLGVADILHGGGAALDGEGAAFSLSDVVASCAVPPLFRAVLARGTLWWDGLYAHNPPIGALLDLPEKPDEIWVIRLNPRGRATEPRTTEEIEDRRNELAGNLPLDQELETMALINRLLAAAPQLSTTFGYRQLTVREVTMPLADLPYSSKLDRSAARLEELMALGRDAAAAFFEPASIMVPPQA
jgi:NTE family protein